jgi:hypothetical protein
LQRSKSWVCSQHPWFFRSSLSQDLCPPCPSAQGVGFTQKESGRYSCSPWPVLVFIEEIWLEDIYIYIYIYLSIYQNISGINNTQASSEIWFSRRPLATANLAVAPKSVAQGTEHCLPSSEFNHPFEG